MEDEKKNLKDYVVGNSIIEIGLEKSSIEVKITYWVCLPFLIIIALLIFCIKGPALLFEVIQKISKIFIKIINKKMVDYDEGKNNNNK